MSDKEEITKQEEDGAESSTSKGHGKGNKSTKGDNAKNVNNHENVSSHDNDRKGNNQNDGGHNDNTLVNDPMPEGDITEKNKEIFALFNDRERLKKLSIEERGEFYETFQMMSRFFVEGGYNCNPNGLNNDGPEKVSKAKINLFSSQNSNSVIPEQNSQATGSHSLFGKYVTPKKNVDSSVNNDVTEKMTKFADIFHSLNQTECAGQIVDVGINKSGVRYMSSKEADIFPTFNGNTIQQLQNWVGQFEKHANKFFGDNNFRWVFEVKKKIDDPLLPLIENIDISELDYCSFVERLIVIVNSMNVSRESSPYERFSNAKLLKNEKLLAYANRLQHLYELTCPNIKDTETSQMLRDKFLGTIPELVKTDLDNRIISVEALTENRILWSQLVRQINPCITSLGSDYIDSRLLSQYKSSGGGSGLFTSNKEKVHFETNADKNVFSPGKRCQYCFRRNHDSSECRINNNSCFKCGSETHFIAKCPLNKEQVKRETARATSDKQQQKQREQGRSRRGYGRANKDIGRSSGNESESNPRDGKTQGRETK